MSRSCPRSERTPPTPYPGALLRLLSPGPHSSLARQGHTRRTANRAAGARHDHPDSRSRWPASSLRPPGGVVQHRLVFTATPPPASLFFLAAVRPLLRISSHRASPTARGCRQPCLVPVSSAWSLSAEHGRASSEPGLSWRSLPCPSINHPRSKRMRFAQKITP